MSEYSLVSILKNDPDFAGALAKRKEIAKKDKQTLVKAAESYSSLYEEEIIEGTKQAQKLISEGSSHGLTEEEAMKQLGRFLPTVRTPILNMLYFLLRESEEVDREMYVLREQYNKQYGHLEDNTPLSENVIDPPAMEEYLYGNMTHETFKKIKKLKSLSHSPNEEEAFLAYRKCHELCKKYQLDFDRIPCNIT
jgi:hypothetical protein